MDSTEFADITRRIILGSFAMHAVTGGMRGGLIEHNSLTEEDWFVIETDHSRFKVTILQLDGSNAKLAPGELDPRD